MWWLVLSHEVIPSRGVWYLLEFQMLGGLETKTFREIHLYTVHTFSNVGQKYVVGRHLVQMAITDIIFNNIWSDSLKTMWIGCLSLWLCGALEWDSGHCLAAQPSKVLLWFILTILIMSFSDVAVFGENTVRFACVDILFPNLFPLGADRDWNNKNWTYIMTRHRNTTPN